MTVSTSLIKAGISPQAVEPTIVAFIKSTYYTGVGLGSLFLLLAASHGALNSLEAFLAYAKSDLWAFIVAQVLVPALRAHAAANLYAPIPEKPP